MMNCNLINYKSVSLTLVILLSGCSGTNVSNFSDSTPSPTISSVNLEEASSRQFPSNTSQFSQTDLAFIADIEAYARNQGTTFSDVTPQQNIETAQMICQGIQNNGSSTSIKNYFNTLADDKFSNLTEGELSSLGYIFSASVKYYCPQYLEDVRNSLSTLRN